MSSDSPSTSQPLSPVLSGKYKNRGRSFKNRDTDSTGPEQLEVVQTDLPQMNAPLDVPKDFSGFRTGSGKEVLVPREALEENLKLFEDILTPSQSNSARIKKFNYLTRPKTDDSGGSSFKGFTEEEVTKAQLKHDIVKELYKRLSQETEERMEVNELIPRKRTRVDKCDEAVCKKPRVEEVLRKKIEQDSTGSPSCSSNKSKEKMEILQRNTQETSRSKLAFFENMLKDQELRDNSSKESSHMFSSASGKPSNLSESLHLKANEVLKDLDLSNWNNDEDEVNPVIPLTEPKENASFPTFSSASGKPFKLSGTAVQKAKEIFKDIDSFDSSDLKSVKNEENTTETRENVLFPTFSSASGKPLKLSGTAVQKAKEIFKDIDSFDSSDLISAKNIGNTTETRENALFPTFSSASGKPLKLSGTAVQKAKEIFKDIDSFDSSDLKSVKNEENSTETRENALFPMFSSASGKPLKLSGTAVQKAKEIFKDIDSLDSSDLKNVKNEENTTETRENLLFPTFSSASGKPFTTSETAIQKANKVFENIDNFDLKDWKSPAKRKTTSFPELSRKLKETLENPSKNEETNSNTPKSRSSRLFSTPPNPTKPRKKLGISSCKQIPVPDKMLLKASLIFDDDLSSISPIRPTNINQSTPNYKNPPTFEKPGKTPVYNEKPSISKTLFDETFTTDDGSFILTPTEGNSKIWIEKLEKKKQELQARLEVITERQQQLIRMEEDSTTIDRKPRTGILFQKKLSKEMISLRRFVGNKKPGDDGTSNHPLWCVTAQNAERFHFTMQPAPTLTTQDGCLVVPNQDDLVGLREIEYSFRNMPGVEPSLLPKDWIRNHYKWVIWKLASYERTFPGEFDGALCVENVVQQLKYRYDREIDKAERSAIRKIFEKDDVAQKRMVLCVSDIRRVEMDFGVNTFTLELTDGWYSIKTIIDEPLTNQITRNKLKIGTKLITCNAELLNCDGCSPLEATDLTSLRINYNCTRRAKWDDRLGYQERPGPFPVPIDTIHSDGGMVGSVGINLVRVYPLKFLEKIDGQSIWRNKRAEDRRAQEWENERHKRMERIYEEMQQRYDRCGNGRSEDLAEELNSQVREEMEKLDGTRRDVLACFKLLVTDRNGDSTRTFNFWVWDPTDWHLGILKEETSFMVYNVLPRKNGDLSTSKRTFFKPLPKRADIPAIFTRRVTAINQLTESAFETFYEFDTVGLVADITIDKYQFVWLCDQSGRLLLIKIFDSPRNCLLLNDLKRGQAITVCNITFKKRHSNDFIEAVGGSSTTFSKYSQYKHLQEGLNNFKANLPENCDRLLEECSERIKLFNTERSDGFTSDDDEGTLTNSKLTRTDIALSLIDINISTGN